MSKRAICLVLFAVSLGLIDFGIVSLILPLAEVVFNISGSNPENGNSILMMSYQDDREVILLSIIVTASTLSVARFLLTFLVKYMSHQYRTFYSVKILREILGSRVFDDKYNYEDIIKRCTADIDAIVGSGVEQILNIITTACILALSLLFMAYVDLTGLVRFALFVTPLYLMIWMFTRKHSRNAANLVTEGNKERYQQIGEFLEGWIYLKVFKIGDKYIERIGESCRKISKAVATNSLLATTPKYLLESFFVIGVAVFGYFSTEIINGESLRNLLILGLVGITKVIPNLNNLYKSYFELAFAKESLKRLEELSKDFAAIPQKTKFKQEQFKEIKFVYVEITRRNKTILLKQLKIEYGDRVLLRGASGEGKSTLLDGILGVLKNSCGNISINGAPSDEGILNYSLSYSDQNLFCLDGNIFENIHLNEENPNIERINKLITLLQLKDIDSRLTLGQRGRTISGGQLKRLNLARCLYKVADVYILDEPTSMLNQTMAEEVYKVIDGFVDCNTLIIVSHSKNIPILFDTELVVSDGHVMIS
jgi:ABC-type bacteriocin/lantibiotic exporter with double-glycine peptidase domain